MAVLGQVGSKHSNEPVEAVGSFIGAVSSQAAIPPGRSPGLPRRQGEGGEEVREDPCPRAQPQSCLGPCSSAALR